MSIQTLDKTLCGARREYLDSLPANYRSRAAKLYLDPIRAAIRAKRTVTAADVVQAVRTEVAHRLKTWRLDADQKAGLEAVRGSLSLACAYDYAAYLICLESFPADQRKTVKKQQETTGTADGEPTDAQLRYLRLLRYKGEAPATLGEALALIGRIKKGGTR